MSSSSSSAAGGEEDPEDPGDIEPQITPGSKRSIESITRERDYAAAATREAGEQFTKRSAGISSTLRDLELTTGPEMNFVGVADISRQAQDMTVLQADLYDQFQGLIDAQKVFAEKSKDKSEAVIRDLSRKADIEAKKKQKELWPYIQKWDNMLLNDQYLNK
jgi:hypothetical protein